MKIFLTGANGMVGRNILEHPEAAGFEFLIPSSKELDLLDYAQVSEFIERYSPDMIIHAAGLVGGIQANIAHPVDFLVRNIDIGRNTILAAKHNGVKRLINLASSCIYPKDGENPLKEEMILTGTLEPTNEGYAIAKIVSARLCEYIHREDQGFEYKTIIPSNIFGRYDKFSPQHSHMLPAAIHKIHTAAISNQESVTIWGTGEARREFMYAGDLADFIFYSIRNFDKMPGYINVGLGTDYTINEYYAAVAAVVGYKGTFSRDLAKPTGMKQKLIDDTKLREFGWQHKTSLHEGIQKTYDYYKTITVND